MDNYNSLIYLFRIMFDIGLLILIWMVQLIVYPSFKHFTKPNLLIWHQKYTNRITFLVLPLMIGQLLLALLQAYISPNSYTLGSLILILCVWSSTFLHFVPIHNKISQGQTNETQLDQLVNKNWNRTALWTLTAIISIVHYISILINNTN